MKLQKNTHLALCSVLEFAARPGERLSAAEIAAIRESVRGAFGDTYVPID